MQLRKEILNKPLYLILLAIYPSVSLIALNIREIDPSTAGRSLLASLLIALIITLFHRIFITNPGYAPIQAGVFLVLFFNYGHFYNLIGGIEITNLKGSQIHLFLLIASLLIYLFARYHKESLLNQTTSINLMSLVLLIIPLIQLGQYTISTRSNNIPETNDSPFDLETNTYPDIYYIILDAYNRADNMLALGFDNSSFLDSLREIGFFVADCSQSNYQRTALSLASSLNMDYLFYAIPNDGPKDENPQPVYNALPNNRVRGELEQIGYQTIAFQSGYRWGEWRDADIYYKPDSNLLFVKYITPFENLFLESTALKIALDFNWLPFLNDTYMLYGEHYERVHYILDTLPEVATLPGPKFIYAHIIVPHSPYVFLPDGSVNPEANTQYWTDTQGYISNVEFINAAIEPVIKQIIQQSENPPIIVLQGDHGTVFLPGRNYFILNAYYLPGKDTLDIPLTITPVNTFRLIFNLYFNTDFPYREDVSFSNDIGHPYKEVIEEFPEEFSQCPPLTP